MVEERGLEGALSRLARIAAALEGDDKLGALDGASVKLLKEATISVVVGEVSKSPESTVAYDDLAAWLASDYYSNPIEVFTLNYDVLLEEALERFKLPYFDGFVGYFKGRFRQDLIDSRDTVLPSISARVNLWKLHGSISWQIEGASVFRVTPPVRGAETAAIYPSDEKYADTRRAPYVALMDHLRRSLAEPQSLTIVSGYSFADEHVNMVLFDAARTNPHAEIFVTAYDAIPENVEAVALAVTTVTVIGRTRAIVGGKVFEYAPAGEDSAETSGECHLGDFAILAATLARTRRPDSTEGTTEAVSNVVPS